MLKSNKIYVMLCYVMKQPNKLKHLVVKIILQTFKDYDLALPRFCFKKLRSFLNHSFETVDSNLSLCTSVPYNCVNTVNDTIYEQHR